MSFDVIVIGSGQGVPALNNQTQLILDSSHLWSALTALPVLLPLDSVFDLNNNGVVAGAYFNGTAYRAAIWSAAGGIVDLGVDGFALGINDSGEVVGAISQPGSKFTPFRYTELTGVQEISTADEFLNTAYINNAGTIVLNTKSGIEVVSGSEASLITVPGPAKIKAFGMNDLGEIVGHTYVPTTTISRAFKWTKCGGLEDLASAYGLNYAYGINNLGEIVGTLHTGARQEAAYISADTLYVLSDYVADGSRPLMNAFAINDCSDAPDYV